MTESHKRNFSFTDYHHENALSFENKNNPKMKKAEVRFHFILFATHRHVLSQLIIRSLCSAVSIFAKSTNSYKTAVLVFLKSDLNIYVYGVLHLFDV